MFLSLSRRATNYILSSQLLPAHNRKEADRDNKQEHENQN
jgi:hypothetical protein